MFICLWNENIGLHTGVVSKDRDRSLCVVKLPLNQAAHGAVAGVCAVYADELLFFEDMLSSQTFSASLQESDDISCIFVDVGVA